MQVFVDGDVVRKVAESPEDRRRLGHEAAVLPRVAHPGVVHLLGSDGEAQPRHLLLRRVGAGDLRGLGLLPVAVVAGLGAALATTLADLHDLGVTHGAIDPSHVLIEEGGLPVLCGFGQARLDLPGAPDARAARGDVAATARMLAACFQRQPPKRVAKMLQRAAAPDRRRPVSARQLARGLLEAVPGARLPATPLAAGGHQPDAADRVHPARDPREAADADATGEPAARPHLARRGRRPMGPRWPRWAARPARWPRWPVLAAAAAVCAVGAVAAIASQSSGGHAALGAPCPPVDASCRPVPHPGGILTTTAGRFRVGRPTDVLVLGRWTCSGSALPALLRRSSGQVWVFDRWAPAGRPEPARLVATVSGAESLRVEPSPSGCDQIEVERSGGRPLLLPGPARGRR